MLAAGFAGGLLGARYHHKADAYLAAEERDRFTGSEPIETTDAAGHRHVSGGGPALATTAEPDIDLRDRDADRRADDRRDADRPDLDEDERVEARTAAAERRDADRHDPTTHR